MENVKQVKQWFFKVELVYQRGCLITARRMPFWGAPYDAVSVIKVTDNTALVEPLLTTTHICTQDMNTFRQYLAREHRCSTMVFTRIKKGKERRVTIKIPDHEMVIDDRLTTAD